MWLAFSCVRCGGKACHIGISWRGGFDIWRVCLRGDTCASGQEVVPGNSGTPVYRRKQPNITRDLWQIYRSDSLTYRLIPR
jgi:hypothetical protein